MGTTTDRKGHPATDAAVERPTGAGSPGLAGPPGPEGDAVVGRLARFFAEHDVWRQAAEYVAPTASSRVTFSHRPGEPWRLVRRGGRTILEPGPCPDPDFAIHFTPGAIERITSVRGGVAEFAIELFSAALETDPDRALRLEVIAPFGRLLRRGYVRLVLAGGAPVLAFGARRGVGTLGELRALVARLRAGTPE